MWLYGFLLVTLIGEIFSLWVLLQKKTLGTRVAVAVSSIAAAGFGLATIIGYHNAFRVNYDLYTGAFRRDDPSIGLILAFALPLLAQLGCFGLNFYILKWR